ncbi:MAG: [FeFe] hydrogenase, group A [Candidatus Paceibacterota bacterium]
MTEVKIEINGEIYSVSPDENILQIALRSGIDIPHFCYHEDLPLESRCRACLVEANGKVTTSCDLKAVEGLSVKTETPEILNLRKTNLELLLAEHKERCPKCQEGLFCKVMETMEKYGISGKEYKRPYIHLEPHKLCQAAEIDPNLCIACNNCVEICKKTGIGFLELKGGNAYTYAGETHEENKDCVYCGQCTVHCPVGAAREQSEIKEVEEALEDSNKTVIAQMAPSVRVSIGEEFGKPVGTELTKECYTAFRKLGFDQVFDVNTGADITTIVEAEELVERIKEGRDLPMFTSCCPAWVKFMEFYHPDLLHLLTSSRSPQIHCGGVYKTWWAEKENIDPKNIVVVSFMPCTSKKYEARHEKLKINGLQPVDLVLTTREMGALLKKHNIDLSDMEPGEADSLGKYSGAGAIYGASGGVMESALRTAYYKISGSELGKLDLQSVRGMKGIKEAEVNIAGNILKVAVVATMKNAAKIIEDIRNGKNKYDYIEVMACPGGCIGGGGQPIPTTDEIVKKRIASIYEMDSGMDLRKAHLNPIVIDLFENYISKLSEEERRALLETHYSPKNKYE